MSARAEILARIDRALADRSAAPPIPRTYRAAGTRGGDVVGLFAERVEDYRADVHRCGPREIPAVVARLTAGRRIVVPPGLPGWLPGALTDDPPLTVDQLDAVDGVLTACTLAIAETGTIVLNHGPGQGRRALTLVPDLHVVVVHADQIVPAVPDAVAALDPTRPMTWISGPSATSDIELSRVEGVHGPRTLHVIIAAV